MSTDIKADCGKGVRVGIVIKYNLRASAIYLGRIHNIAGILYYSA